MQIVGISVSTPVPIPLLTRAVRAGFPSPADDFIEESIDLQRLLIANRAATFIVKVAGDSMIGKGLFDGDLAIVDRSLVPHDGDIVVVDVDNERSFKVWSRRGGRSVLAFANPRYPAFEHDADAVVEIWGVVSGSINPLRRLARRWRSSTATASTARASASSIRGSIACEEFATADLLNVARQETQT